jgi:hypothetical protein
VGRKGDMVVTDTVIIHASLYSRRIMNLTRTNHNRRNRTLLSTAFRNERAALDLASIMVGIIIIGLIGSVIAATVFAVIPWAQDNAAKQQLDSVVTAESAAKGMDSNYSANLKGYLDTDALAVSKVRIQSDEKNAYAAFAKSGSGNYFYITSANSQPQALGKKWPSAKPANYPTAIKWPANYDAAAVQSTGDSELVTDPEQVNNWPGTQTTKLSASDAGVPANSPLSSVIRLNAGGDTLQQVDYTKQPLADASTVWRVSAWVSTTSDTEVPVALGTWLGPYSGPPAGGVLQTNTKIKKSDGWVHVVKVIGINSPQSDASTSWWYSDAMLGQQYNWRAYMSTNADGGGKVYVSGLQVSKVN